MRRSIFAGALTLGLLVGSAPVAGAAPAAPTRSSTDGGWLAYSAGSTLVLKGTFVVPAWSCAGSVPQSGVGFLLFADYTRNHKTVADAIGVSTDCSGATPVTRVDTELGGPATFPEGQGHENEIKAGDTLELSIGVRAQRSTIRLDDVTHPALITATAPGGRPYAVEAVAAAIFNGPTALPTPHFAGATFSRLLVDKKPMGGLAKRAYDLVRGKKVEITTGPFRGGTSFTLTGHG